MMTRVFIAGSLLVAATQTGCRPQHEAGAPANPPPAGVTGEAAAAPLAPAAAGVAMTETQKIEKMLARLAESDAVFIRNGSEYDGKAAAHLRSKWSNAGSRVKTAQEFIDGLASTSSSTGKAYQIRKGDGSVVLSREWFLALLATVEAGK